jgi:hypothetical protein
MEEATESTVGNKNKKEKKKGCSFNVHMRNCFLLQKIPITRYESGKPKCDSYLTVTSCHHTIKPLMPKDNFSQHAV